MLAPVELTPGAVRRCCLFPHGAGAVFFIQPCSLPDGALLSKYSRDGAYTDCYMTELSDAVSHAQYVAAFYTTWVFKLERLILKYAVSRPSTDAQAELLAAGTIDSFAAWHVERRCENQLLMCDFRGRTRSWFMLSPLQPSGHAGARLYFGSAVVPVKNPKTGVSGPGFGFRALLGFHRIYSQILLLAARESLHSAIR
jgi:hypothetical protein